MKKIVFTGGGTAGHIMPNLAIIEELKDYEIFYIGSNGMEKDIISKYTNIKFFEIPSVKLKRSLTIENLLIPFKLIRSIQKSKEILRKINPCIVFSKGGYVSVPTSIAAQSLKIPVITHESDYSIGLANKIIAKKSKVLCCTFRDTAEKYEKNAVFTGSPIRNKIMNGNGNIIKQRHNIHTNKPIILIVGGSQGAKVINSIIFDNIKQLTKKYTILHIVGKNNIENNIKHSDYYQIPFADDIENYFDACDLVITRAGSNTIFELLEIEKPMILIPLPKTKHSRGDQVLNAQYFENNRLAKHIPQNLLSIDSLLFEIEHILKNKNKYIENMKKSNCHIGNNQIVNLIKRYENKNHEL